MRLRRDVLMGSVALAAGLGLFFFGSAYYTEKNVEILNIDVETEGWETYRSDEYGFEIKVPQGYSVEPEDYHGKILWLEIFEKKLIGPPRGGGHRIPDLYVSLPTGTEGKSLESFIDAKYEDSLVSLKKVNLNGAVWHQVDFFQDPDEYLSADRGRAFLRLNPRGEVVTVGGFYYRQSDGLEIMGNYEPGMQILSTFKFTE